MERLNPTYTVDSAATSADHTIGATMEELTAPLAIVTGGADGLGYELLVQLLDRGYTVCNIDFDDIKMASLPQRLSARSSESASRYHGFIGDIADEDFTRRCVQSISQIAPISLLINNAGQPSFKKPTEYTSADIERCLTGLRGMILWTTAVLRATHEQAVKIVNVMSSAALRGNPQESVYCAAKWGERGYTESLKAAYKASSVKIIGFYPGGIDTNFYTESRDYVDEGKQHSFMSPAELATILLDNILSKANLTVSDLIVERNH
jgi:short-subunit dehydrogenase